MGICEHDFIPTFPDSSQYYCIKCNLGGTAVPMRLSPSLDIVITEPYTVVKNNKIVSIGGRPVGDMNGSNSGGVFGGS